VFILNIQLGLGFVIAEAVLSTNHNLAKLFYECKDYIVATCQGSIWNEKVDDLCQVGFIRLQDTDIYEIIQLDQKLLLAIISII
jgi:hypothetical protein